MIRILLYLFGAIAIVFAAYGTGNAADTAHPMMGDMQSGHMMHDMGGGQMMGGHMMDGKMMDDKRIPLNLPPMMAQHQKANMREHLKAAADVVHYMGANDFAAASKTAKEKLGLTAQMKQMCDNMPNETFRTMALDFHKSGDALAEALKTKDTGKSLKALDAMLAKCTACHEMFRQ